VTISPLFCDIVTQSLAQRVPLDLVGQIDTRVGLEQKLAARAPDLLLIGLVESEGGAFALSLTQLLPQAAVLAFSSDLQRVYACRKEHQPIVLEDASPDSLAETIISLRQ
jgi:hypothetical protein